jgi:parvulin-like peptidyl-prolyl isomerase
MWKQQREQLLPRVRAQLAKQSLLEQIEKVQREVPPPTSAEVSAYYDQHNELFTEPEKLRLSLILLKVDPSAPSATWDQAREEAQAIYQRIQKGADFSEMARLHSSDESAVKGGDIGYIHRGMLPEVVHEKIDKARLGDVSEPITMLEGVALIRLDERVVPKLRRFPDVEKRARELLTRERQELAKKEALVHLRSVAKIEILVPKADD